MKEMSKGRKIRKGPKTAVVAKPTSPLTRSSAMKISPDIQGKQATSQKSPTSPAEEENNIRQLNKRLRQAQDEIIKLREEKRLSYDRAMKHFKECKPTRENAYAYLSNAQSKLKRNAALFRKVGNLKVQILTLRKEKENLKKRLKLNDEARIRLELLQKKVEIE